MSVPQRYGITVPFDGVPLHAHREWFEEIAALGYTDLWSAESGGADAFTPLALAAAWTPSLRLGTAIVPAYHTWRGDARRDRRQHGAGRAGAVRARDRHVVQRHRRELERHPVRGAVPARARHDPLPPHRARGREGHARVRDVLGEGLPARHPRRRAPADPRRRAAAGHAAPRRARRRRRDHQLALRRRRQDRRARTSARARRSSPASSCCRPTTTRSSAPSGKRAIAAYLNVPVYAAFHDWLGRGEILQPMWDAWKAGDREAATAAIPDELVDELDRPRHAGADPRAPGPLRRQRGHDACARVPRRSRRRAPRAARGRAERVVVPPLPRCQATCLSFNSS